MDSCRSITYSLYFCLSFYFYFYLSFYSFPLKFFPLLCSLKKIFIIHIWTNFGKLCPKDIKGCRIPMSVTYCKKLKDNHLVNMYQLSSGPHRVGYDE